MMQNLTNQLGANELPLQDIGDIKLKTVVSEQDLTLWNSWYIHLRPLLADLGKEYQRPFFEHMAWFFPGDQEKVMETYMGFYHASFWQERRLYPGVLELLQQLKQYGYRTAILSDKRQMFGVPEFEYSSLSVAVDHAQFFADGMAAKPDPDGLQDVMRSLGVLPGECLFVGDSYRDIEYGSARRGLEWCSLVGVSGARAGAGIEPGIPLERVNDIGLTLKLNGTS